MKMKKMTTIIARLTYITYYDHQLSPSSPIHHHSLYRTLSLSFYLFYHNFFMLVGWMVVTQYMSKMMMGILRSYASVGNFIFIEWERCEILKKNQKKKKKNDVTGWSHLITIFIIAQAKKKQKMTKNTYK